MTQDELITRLREERQILVEEQVAFLANEVAELKTALASISIDEDEIKKSNARIVFLENRISSFHSEMYALKKLISALAIDKDETRKAASKILDYLKTIESITREFSKSDEDEKYKKTLFKIDAPASCEVCRFNVESKCQAFETIAPRVHWSTKRAPFCPFEITGEWVKERNYRAWIQF